MCAELSALLGFLDCVKGSLHPEQTGHNALKFSTQKYLSCMRGKAFLTQNSHDSVPDRSLKFYVGLVLICLREVKNINNFSKGYFSL